MKKDKAFTLAETLIVLVILGIVAAITIPALVRRHVESSNRTRIKKAMSVYDTAINKMVVENGIKNNDALINEFNADKNNNSCAKSRAYFKTSQDGANDCTFRASDGVWWNIENITHPIIAFNEDDLTDEIASGDTNRAFHLVGYLDDNGSLRVSDLAKAEGENLEYLTKLYNYINNKKETSSGEVAQENPFDKCNKNNENLCIVDGIEWTKYSSNSRSFYYTSSNNAIFSYEDAKKYCDDLNSKLLNADEICEYSLGFENESNFVYGNNGKFAIDVGFCIDNVSYDFPDFSEDDDSLSKSVLCIKD